MAQSFMERAQEYAQKNRQKAIDTHVDGAAPSPAPAASAPAPKPPVDFFKSEAKNPARESAKQKALVEKLRARGDF
jgi:hypothetical protein